MVRLGAGAGFAGDRIAPAVELAERGGLDWLVFECLAERTIALAQLERLRDPSLGFDPLLRERMRAVLAPCLAGRTRILSNMGAAHPLGAAAAVQEVARSLKLPRFAVAAVTGDDVLATLLERGLDLPLIDRPLRLRDVRERLVSANAYLGAEALLPALATPAPVVITGRVADPALFLAPLVHAFGWPLDDWTRLGRGVAVGHLLECAAQVTGGYFADPGQQDVPDLARLGFPLAEVSASGEAVITKLPGSGGRVSVASCTEQLLYEVEDPARYLQPDVVADFSRIELVPDGCDRVRVLHAGGSARTDTLKVTLGLREGFIGEGQISYAGPGARARGELALALVRERLASEGLGRLPTRGELIGVNAILGGDSRHEPDEVRLRVAVHADTAEQAQRAAREVEALYLNGPAGGGGATRQVHEVIAVESLLMPRHWAQPQVHLVER